MAQLSLTTRYVEHRYNLNRVLHESFLTGSGRYKDGDLLVADHPRIWQFNGINTQDMDVSGGALGPTHPDTNTQHQLHINPGFMRWNGIYTAEILLDHGQSAPQNWCGVMVQGTLGGNNYYFRLAPETDGLDKVRVNSGSELDIGVDGTCAVRLQAARLALTVRPGSSSVILQHYADGVPRSVTTDSSASKLLYGQPGIQGFGQTSHEWNIREFLVWPGQYADRPQVESDITMAPVYRPHVINIQTPSKPLALTTRYVERRHNLNPIRYYNFNDPQWSVGKSLFTDYPQIWEPCRDGDLTEYDFKVMDVTGTDETYKQQKVLQFTAASGSDQDHRVMLHPSQGRWNGVHSTAIMAPVHRASSAAGWRGLVLHGQRGGSSTTAGTKGILPQWEPHTEGGDSDLYTVYGSTAFNESVAPGSGDWHREHHPMYAATIVPKGNATYDVYGYTYRFPTGSGNSGQWQLDFFKAVTGRTDAPPFGQPGIMGWGDDDLANSWGYYGVSEFLVWPGYIQDMPQRIHDLTLAPTFLRRPHVRLIIGTVTGAPGGPTITNVNPSTISSGDSVTITGTNFGASQGSSTVDIGGVTQTVNTWSDTSLTINSASLAGIPTSVTSVYVRVDVN